MNRNAVDLHVVLRPDQYVLCAVDHPRLHKIPPIKMCIRDRMVGIANEFYFSRLFKQLEGISPSEFRRLYALK